MDWQGFRRSAPALARQTEEIFGRNGLALIGTLRTDGFPRISPVEVFFLPREVLLGMMYKSRKALDLLRDPRCVLHSTVSNPNGSEPELKMYGRAMAGEKGAKARYRKAYAKRWKRAAPSTFPGHVFSFEVESVALISYDPKKMTMAVRRWNDEEGVREFKRQYP